MRFQRNPQTAVIVDQDNGFVRSVFPDGTIEEQNENGEMVYIFDEFNNLRVDSYGDVFRTINGVATVENIPQEVIICGPKGEALSSIGITVGTDTPKVFKKDSAVNDKLLEVLQKNDLFGAEKILREMSDAQHFVEVERIFSECVLSTDPAVWEFIQTRLKYIPSKYVWEKIALKGLEIKAAHLDVPSNPLAFMLEMPNKEWITNTFIASVLSHRRYDLVEHCFKYGTDFRTHSERMCHYAYTGNNFTLTFMEDAGSTIRAMALYLAALNNQTGIAKSLLRSFTKEQQNGLKKMFARCKNNPKQLLNYFT